MSRQKSIGFTNKYKSRQIQATILTIIVWIPALAIGFISAPSLIAAQTTSAAVVPESTSTTGTTSFAFIPHW